MGKQLRFGSMDKRPLEHTSFWMDPWSVNFIRMTAIKANVSQALLLNAILLDYYLRSLAPEKMQEPAFARCRKFADLVLRRIH